MVCKALDREKEQFIRPVVEYPDGDDFGDVHKAFINAALLGHTNLVYEKHLAECYINSLPQTNFNRLKNKVNMTTAVEMYESLAKDRAFINACADRATAAVPIAPIEEGDIKI